MLEVKIRGVLFEDQLADTVALQVGVDGEPKIEHFPSVRWEVVENRLLGLRGENFLVEQLQSALIQARVVQIINVLHNILQVLPISRDLLLLLPLRLHKPSRPEPRETILIPAA